MEVDSPVVCSQVSGLTVQFSGKRHYIVGWTSLEISKESIVVPWRVPSDTISLPRRPESLTVPLWELQISTNLKLCAKFYNKIVSFRTRILQSHYPTVNLESRSLSIFRDFIFKIFTYNFIADGSLQRMQFGHVAPWFILSFIYLCLV